MATVTYLKVPKLGTRFSPSYARCGIERGSPTGVALAAEIGAMRYQELPGPVDEEIHFPPVGRTYWQRPMRKHGLKLIFAWTDTELTLILVVRMK